MKQIKICVILFMVFLLLSCCISSFSDENTVVDYLEDKYSKDFEATHIGREIDKTKLYVKSESDDSIIFTAYIDDNGDISDDYVNRVILAKTEKMIEDEMSAHGIECSVNVVVDKVNETDPSLSITEFMDKNSLEYLYMRLIVEESSFTQAEVKDVFKHLNCLQQINYAVNGYIMTTDTYSMCKDDFETYPSVNTTKIKSYKPIDSFRLVRENGKVTVDEKE